MQGGECVEKMIVVVETMRGAIVRCDLSEESLEINRLKLSMIVVVAGNTNAALLV
jgi:hypothetical protein